MQKKLKQSNQMVQVMVLERGKPVKTIMRPKAVAERLAKFKNSFRIEAPIEPPKPGTFEKVEEKLKKEEQAPNAFEKELKEIAGIKDVALLEPFLEHEAKTVQLAAGKKFRELTDKKTKK